MGTYDGNRCTNTMEGSKHFISQFLASKQSVSRKQEEEGEVGVAENGALLRSYSYWLPSSEPLSRKLSKTAAVVALVAAVVLRRGKPQRHQ
jgi:hypothetical protein